MWRPASARAAGRGVGGHVRAAASVRHAAPRAWGGASAAPAPTRPSHSAAPPSAPLASTASLLSALRDGLQQRDLEQVWYAWDGLGERGELARLRVPERADLLALVRSQLAAIAPRRTPWAGDDMRAPEWRARCRAWGQHAAHRKDVLGVQGWMRVELMCGSADGAIDIFNTYVDARAAQQPHASGVPDASAPTSAAPVSPAPLPCLDRLARLRPKVRDVLELVVFSYALRDDLPGLIDQVQAIEFGTHTEPFFNLSHARRHFGKTAQVLPQATAPDAHERALRWTLFAELARGLQGGSGSVAGPNRIARLLGSLLARRDVTAFWRLFRAAMDGGVLRGESGTEDSLLAADTSATQIGCVPPFTEEIPADALRREDTRSWRAASHCGLPIAAWTESAWSVSLRGLLAARRPDLAAQAWAALASVQSELDARTSRADGSTPSAPRGRAADWPSIAVFNSLLDGHAQAGDFAAAQATWRFLTTPGMNPAALPIAQGTARGMQRPADLRPDVLSYTTMITAAFRERRVALALDLFSELQKSDRLVIGTQTYNVVVHGLCIAGRLNEARAVVAAMGSDGMPPATTATINTLLRAQARRKDLRAMATSLRLIRELDLQPDVVTFTTVLDALLRAVPEQCDADRAVRQVLDIMESLHVKPNTVTLTAMVKAYLDGDDGAWSSAASPDRVHSALQLLQTMCTSKLAPNLFTYTAVIAHAVDAPRSIRALAADARVPALFAAAPAPVAALGETADAVEAGMPLEGDAAGLRVALRFWELMRADDIVPSWELCHTMLRALLVPSAPPLAFRRGVLLADEFLRAGGRLVAALGRADIGASVTVPGSDAAKSHAAQLAMPLPVPASYTLLLSLLLAAAESAPRNDRVDLERVLSAAAQHAQHAAPDSARGGAGAHLVEEALAVVWRD
ncbi:hypothetical protein MSPP1_000283 [Malassezia sp. CBS 17886]|nr:hypothetical protein MSPP1_000283 [Malassezia sp. CBS 17886]